MGNSEIIRDGASMRPSGHGPRDRAISQEGTQCPALHHNLGSSVTLDGTSMGTSGFLSSREAQNVLRTLAIAYSWAESPNSLFHSEVLNISCSLLSTVLKVKTEWPCVYRAVVRDSVVYLPDHEVGWQLGLNATAHETVADPPYH